MTTLDSDCGSQGNLLSQSTRKNGADLAPFFLSRQRDIEAEIRQYLERHLDSEQIAHRMRIDQSMVDKYLSTLRSPL